MKRCGRTSWSNVTNSRLKGCLYVRRRRRGEALIWEYLVKNWGKTMKKQRTHCAPAIWQAIWAVQVSDSATPPPTTRTFLWDGEHSRRVSVLLGEVLRCLKEVGLEPTLLKGTSPGLMLIEDKGFSEVTCAGIRESGRAIKLYSAIQCSILLWSPTPQTTLLLTTDEIYGSHTITSEIFTKQATRFFVRVDWIAPETCTATSLMKHL